MENDSTLPRTYQQTNCPKCNHRFSVEVLGLNTLSQTHPPETPNDVMRLRNLAARLTDEQYVNVQVSTIKAALRSSGTASAPLPPPQARTSSEQITKMLELKCGLCGKPIGESHDCPVKLSHLQSALISVIVSVDFCDHYCCGDTDWVCKVKTLAHELLDPESEVVGELRKALAESAPQEAGAPQCTRCDKPMTPTFTCNPCVEKIAAEVHAEIKAETLTIEQLAKEMGNAGYCNYSACQEFLQKAYDLGRRGVPLEEKKKENLQGEKQ